MEGGEPEYANGKGDWGTAERAKNIPSSMFVVKRETEIY
jgi:hypothetical protein